MISPAEIAAVAWARAYEGMWDMADGFHGSINMPEVIALADLLEVAGRPDLAAIMWREWTLIEHAEHELDDFKRVILAGIVGRLPAIPDHRVDGDFDWTPYITPDPTEG